MNILECYNIDKFYADGNTNVQALSNVSITIPSGAFVCISGRSGSGKTTLLNCLGTLDRVTHGKIILDGNSIENIPESALLEIRRTFFGFIFQQPRLFPYLTVLENISLPLVFRGKRWTDAGKTASALTEEIMLSERKGYQARLLSGGEAQRVAIARALAYRPKILLADEPTGELDTATSKTIVDLLARQTRQGMTVIAASHDSVILEKADVVYRLEDGKLAK